MKIARRDFVRAGAGSALLAGLGLGPAQAAGSTAPNVVVYCDPALRHACESLDAPFRQSGGGRLNVFCAPPWMMLAQIERVTQNDVLVSGELIIEDATRRGLIKAPSRMSLGRNRLALATRNEANEALAKDAGSLIGAGPLAVADPTSIAGIDSAAALAVLGLRPPYPFKLVSGADAEDVAFLLANRQARFGLLHVTEALATPDLAVAARFPTAEREGYAAAISTVTRSPNAVRFMNFLRSPAARTHLQAAGLEDLA